MSVSRQPQAMNFSVCRHQQSFLDIDKWPKGGGGLSAQVFVKPNKLPLRGSVTDDTPSGVFGTYPKTAPRSLLSGLDSSSSGREIKNKFSTRHTSEPSVLPSVFNRNAVSSSTIPLVITARLLSIDKL